MVGPDKSINAQKLQQDVEQFKEAIEQYAKYCTEDGIKVRLYLGEDLPSFTSLNPSQRQTAIKSVKDANAIFDGLRSENATLIENKKLLWRALVYWGLVPSKDTLEKVQDGDFLQIYSDENIALFWSPDLMALMSIPLESAFTQPWYHIVERSEADTQVLIDAATGIFTGKYPDDFEPNLPEHYVRETKPEDFNEFMMKVRWACPLRVDKSVKGLLVIHTLRLIQTAK